MDVANCDLGATVGVLLRDTNEKAAQAKLDVKIAIVEDTKPTTQR